MENEVHIAKWNECLNVFRNILQPAEFNTWFQPIVPLSLCGSTLTVEVPSDFFREWLEGHYLSLLKATLKRFLGEEARLIYQFPTVSSQPEMMIPEQGVENPGDRSVSIVTSGSTNPGAMVYPGIYKVSVPTNLNTAYCFRNMAEGMCNKLGISAGKSIADAPGKTPYNPLFVFGGPGVGKTHLAQAIGLAISEKFPDLVVLYVTGNEFKTQYMEATYVKNKLTDFLAFYMKMDVLIVDDIQDLQGPHSQNAFFNVFNHLHQNGKQLIFTSDRAPVELKNFEERLMSRFKWGLAVELQRPDYTTRLNMLKTRCFNEGVNNISIEVLEYIAAHVKNNFRELEGALMSVIARATLLHQEITVELASQVVNVLVDESGDDLSIDKVQSMVCEYFNITRDQMHAPTRKRQVVQARQIAMFLCRNMISNCSLSTIGHEIGGKDHATVLHACNTVSDLMSTDKIFRKYVSDIQSMLSTTDRQ